MTTDDRTDAAAFWDDRYRSGGRVWTGHPNPQLLAEATDLPPGSALDVGCGEGADALWLAERGWQVTALDLSAVALDRAAQHAHDRGLTGRTTWVRGDLLDGEAPPERYDLVTAHFVHLAEPQRGELHRRLAAAVAPGGTLLVVLHSPSDLDTSAQRPPLPELYCTAHDVVARLDPPSWEVVVAEARPRSAPDPDGVDITVHDEVVRARRVG